MDFPKAKMLLSPIVFGFKKKKEISFKNSFSVLRDWSGSKSFFVERQKNLIFLTGTVRNTNTHMLVWIKIIIHVFIEEKYSE